MVTGSVNQESDVDPDRGKERVILVTLRTMTTGGLVIFWYFAGSAAAGVSEFFRRRAGIPVTEGVRQMFVLFTTGTGMRC